jgi:hypothetical protein
MTTMRTAVVERISRVGCAESRPSISSVGVAVLVRCGGLHPSSASTARGLSWCRRSSVSVAEPDAALTLACCTSVSRNCSISFCNSTSPAARCASSFFWWLLASATLCTHTRHARQLLHLLAKRSTIWRRCHCQRTRRGIVWVWAWGRGRARGGARSRERSADCVVPHSLTNGCLQM